MDDQTNRLARELRDNPALLRSVMRSPDARQLLDTLNRDSAGFQSAVRAAAGGDSTELERRLRTIAGSPDGAALLGRIEHALQR